MALRVLNPGVQPLGQFDGLDSDYLTLLGGECVTFVRTSLAGSDKFAKDAGDGYVYQSAVSYRAAVSKVLSNGSGPYMLADEGTVGYGTLFGQVVGGVGGQVTGGAQLGPHTASGSGKVTCWDKPGLYGITLDALAADIQPTSNGGIGSTVYANASTGQLQAASGGGAVKVGRLVEFMTDGSLVKTPNQLVAALNSPLGEVSSAIGPTFYMAVVHFTPPNP
jgi:hypothetical protein